MIKFLSKNTATIMKVIVDEILAKFSRTSDLLALAYELVEISETYCYCKFIFGNKAGLRNVSPVWKIFADLRPKILMTFFSRLVEIC